MIERQTYRTHGERGVYVSRFEQALRNWLFISGQYLNAEEVIQTEVVKVLERFVAVQAAHPDPEAFGWSRAVSRHASIDWLRRDAVQAGRGATNRRAVVDGNGSMSGEQQSRSWFDHLSLEAARAEAYDVAEMFHRQEMVAAVLAGLSEEDRYLLEQVYLQNRSQSELAAELGVARETVNRRLQRALATARESAGPATEG
jgi:RNA polymerase sigma factor (sigma-70 family)